MNRPFSDQDVATLITMFEDYESLAAIGKKLGRSQNSLDQKVKRMGLTRNSHTVRMVSVYGAGVLNLGTEPEAIKKALKQIKKDAFERGKRDKALRQQNAIKILHDRLAGGMPRNVAIRAAHEQGALIRQIAEVVKISRAAVGFILSPQKLKPAPWLK